KVDSVFFAPWIAIAVVSSVFSWAWDTKMDWGLANPTSKHKWLRDNISLPEYAYYGAVVLNLLLRAAWVVSISPSVLGVNPDWLAFLVAGLEIVRRAQWIFFRLENEH